MGIMLLEKQILTLQDQIRNSERDVLLERSWYQLSSLYKRLGEEDILLGLYERNSKQNTKDALTTPSLNIPIDRHRDKK